MTPAEPEKANLIALIHARNRATSRDTIPIPEPPVLPRSGNATTPRSPQYRICRRVGHALAPSPNVRREFTISFTGRCERR
jgi:hypothetical protein